MEIVTSRPLRISGNPGGQINVAINRRLTVSDDLAREMIDRGMAEEIKQDILKQEDLAPKKKKGKE